MDATTRLDEVSALLRVARWRARSWSWTAATTTRLDEVSALLRVARWRARSWSWTVDATTRLDEVGALLHVARWRVRSWSWTVDATTRLDEVSALLHVARWRAQSWSWTAAAAARLDEDRFQLEKTLHTRTHHPPHPLLLPSPPLPPSTRQHRHNHTPRCHRQSQGFPFAGFFPQGAPGAEHHIHLTLSHASYFLLTRPMSHRLRRAPAAYCL